MSRASSSFKDEAERDAAEMLAIQSRDDKRGKLAPMMMKMTATEAKKAAAMEQLALLEQEAEDDARKLESATAFMSLDDVDKDKKEVNVCAHV